MHERDAGALAPWLARAEASGETEFREFAAGLRRDLAAVEAALTHEWSRGQVEGQVNRLKSLKRTTPPHGLLYICFTCWWQRMASPKARIASPGDHIAPLLDNNPATLTSAMCIGGLEGA